MSPVPIVFCVVALLLASSLWAAETPQPRPAAVPVKVYNADKIWRGGPKVEIALPATDGSAYSLVSVYKVGGKPWADLVARREAPDGGVTYLSRTYDCAHGTWRWLGEGNTLGAMTAAVASVGQTGPRAIEPGTVEGGLAAFACGM